MKTTISKRPILERGVKKEVRRDLKAWRAIDGIWKGKKKPDPVAWQRRIRRDNAR